MVERPSSSELSRWRRRVLVTRLSALGDVAMTVPVLYSACRRNSDTLIVLVTKRSVTGVFVNAPENLRVVGIDPREHKGLKGLWRLSAELMRGWRIDAYADLHDVLRTKVMRLWARTHGVACSRIDKGRGEKERLTRSREKELVPLRSSHQRYAEALREVGVESCAAEDFVSLYSGTEADSSLYAQATGPKGAGERWIGIAPFAAHRGKIYPVELMRKVVEILSGDERVRVFVFGAGAEESAVADAWERELPRVKSLASMRLGFAAELALMSSLDVMLTMDSGNMHLAALTGTRVVSIWGATHPYCGFRGWGQSDEDTIQLALNCRPCSVYGNKKCHRKDYQCLNISPQLVARRLTEI